MTSKLPLIPIRLAVAEPIIVLIDSIRESATIASYAVLIISLVNVWLGGLGDSWLQRIRDILPHDVGASIGVANRDPSTERGNGDGSAGEGARGTLIEAIA